MNILTAGESHGPQLTAIIDGFPSGVAIDIEAINHVLAQRQQGYGRGGRMKIEHDSIQITSGVRHGITIGSPITLVIENRDFEHWRDEMGVEETTYQTKRAVTAPRPGHADLAGGMKRQFHDLRNVLERSSARETAIRVAIGALCEQLLTQLGIHHYSRVISIGSAQDKTSVAQFLDHPVVDTDCRCASIDGAKAMKHVIDEAKQQRTTVGGVVQTIITGLPAGLGDYTQSHYKIDARLSMAVMSINAFKGVSFGDGFDIASMWGRDAMDEIYYDGQFRRRSNVMGGIEGGMTNGEPLIINGAMKPIPTQYYPLETVDIITKASKRASVERSDACAVPAASIVMEYVSLTELTAVILDTFDSSTYMRLKQEWDHYCHEMEAY